jgi:hypothetical protein
MKPYQLVLGATALEITQEPVASNLTELLTIHEIVAVSSVYNKKPNRAEVRYINESGPFELGETVTGGTSGATGVIQSFNGTVGFVLSDVVGIFVDGETITGGTSTETADIDGDPIPMSFDGEWTYPYPTMTVVSITMADQSKTELELQECTNQLTWNGGTFADLQQAISDINAWL